MFSLNGETLPAGARELLQTAARAVFRDSAGALGAQLASLRAREPAARPRLANKADPSFDAMRNVPPLELFNGLGGFAAEAREYVTVLKEREWTPAPWSNVIANPEFGFLVSADGVGSTYSINAQQNQLTPWSNDPVSNAPAEVVYIRDQDSGDLWSATPLPIREAGSAFVVSHGFGYTRFQYASRGIALELSQFVPLADPIKVARLKIANRGDTVRNLSITHYLEWVLGNQRARTAPFIITEIDRDTCSAPRAQSLEHRFSGACRFHGHGWAAAGRLRRSCGVPRQAWVAGRARRTAQARSVVEPRGRRLRPVRRPADRGAPRAGRRDRDRPPARPGGLEKRGAAIDRALPQPRTSTHRSRRSRSSGTRRSAPSR